MSPLERRCRLLLLAYPASYSRDRGEEILGTLMEATPERRRRPLLRDVRALVAGGFRARAAQHRRETTAANLRLAALLGVLIYLSLGAFGFVDDFVGPELNPTATFSFGPSGWRALLAGLLLVVVVILVWFGSRSVLVAAALAAAAAVPYSGFTQGQLTGATITELLCLAAVVALAWHSERPSWAWLWLIGVVAVADPARLPSVRLLLAIRGAGPRIAGARRHVRLDRRRRPASGRSGHVLAGVLALDNAGQPRVRCRPACPVGDRA